MIESFICIQFASLYSVLNTCVAYFTALVRASDDAYAVKVFSCFLTLLEDRQERIVSSFQSLAMFTITSLKKISFFNYFKLRILSFELSGAQGEALSEAKWV
mgnify:CR=1 FL=1